MVGTGPQIDLGTDAMWDDLDDVDVFAALADYAQKPRDNRAVDKIRIGKDVAAIMGLQNLDNQQLRELGKAWDVVLQSDLKKQRLTHSKSESRK